MMRNKIHLKIVIMALAALFGVLVALYTWRDRMNIRVKYAVVYSRQNSANTVVNIAPTAENIFKLQEDCKWLRDKETRLLHDLKGKKIEDKGLTPLQFKEELLNVQTSLKKLSGIQGSIIQEDIGFSEFASGQIPDVNEVPLLSRQLAVINETLNIFLKHKVGTVGSIARSNKIYYDEKEMYNEILIGYEITCTMEDLIKILNDIVNAPYIMIVRGLKISDMEGSRLNVELAVGEVEIQG